MITLRFTYGERKFGFLNIKKTQNILPMIPDRTVLHMGTNKASYCKSEKTVDQKGLKKFILQKPPTCEIIISTPTLRASSKNRTRTLDLKKNRPLKNQIRRKIRTLKTEKVVNCLKS